MRNGYSLKAHCRNLAKEKNLSAQVVMQNYMIERLLARISVSKYRDHFILKGGVLVAALTGLENRTTMDLDVTLQHMPLQSDVIQAVTEEHVRSYSVVNTLKRDIFAGSPIDKRHIIL